MNKLTIKFMLCWIYAIVVPTSITYVYIELLTGEMDTLLSMKILLSIMIIAIMISSIVMFILLKVKLIPKVKIKLKYNLALGIFIEDGDINILLPFVVIALIPKKI